MKRLSLIDDTFLRLESRRQPLHIGTLMLFEPPKGAPDDFVQQVADRLRQSTKAEIPFNRRLVMHRGLHYWEEDDEFDLAHHFAHIALPKPGRIRELLALVSRVHCGHLDRAYPLWRMYLIEGIEDGRFAVYMKVHHSMVDGVAGMRMLMKAMSPDPAESQTLPPFWETSVQKSGTEPLPVPSAAPAIAAMRSLARDGIKSVRPLMRELRDSIKDLWNKNPDLVLAGQAPRCIFNQKVSATRRFAAQSYSTARIRAVAKAYDATVNDVVLAMCGGALRRYLHDMNELPEKPLIAGVPVSIRRDNSELGNEVTFSLTHLATHLDEPAERLRAIKSCMDYNKEHMRNLTTGQYITAAAIKMLPGAANALLGYSSENALGNIVISHVPGPRQTMYWQGARLSGLYPASLIIDSAALNITLVSRHDYVDVGLIACRKAVPHVQRLLQYLEDALTELEMTVKPARARKPRSARASTPRKAKASKTSAARKKVP